MRFSKIVYLICCLAVLMIFSSARIASGEESAVQSSREEESNAKVLDNPVPITVEFRDTDIKDVLRSIAEICQVNIVSADNVKGKITISLKEVKLKDALEAILSVNKYAWRPQGEKIIIVEALPALTTKFIQLKYAEAAKMK
ncbi:MAG: hypothetical protein JW774_01235, partial [Candidatus Aureabacteria bacterium]|nr:hypothetical protein [Candidatus Auribacterota bacterium]